MCLFVIFKMVQAVVVCGGCGRDDMFVGFLVGWWLWCGLDGDGGVGGNVQR